MTRRSNGEPAQWRLPDGAVGTQVGEHQGELVLMVSRPNWPFPKAVAISREVCERIEPQPMDTNQQEEARW